MTERSHVSGGGRTSTITGVVMPVVILLIVIAVVTGLVFGGVLQGKAERSGPEPGTTTEATIVIEP